MQQHIFVIGTLAEGFRFVGPFDDVGDLDAVAHYYGKDPDHVEAIELEPRPEGLTS